MNALSAPSQTERLSMKAQRLPVDQGTPMHKLEQFVESVFPDRYRLLTLTSPVWLAGLLMVAGAVSPQFRHILQFVTSSPLR